MAEKGKEKKTEEEYEKEYSTKIAVFTKALETEKADKLLIDLIEVIPREIKIQSLKVRFPAHFRTSMWSYSTPCSSNSRRKESRTLSYHSRTVISRSSTLT